MWPTHYIPNQPRVEGVPPPRYYLTTPPYPVEVSESLESAGGEPDLGFTPSATDEAYMTSGGMPVSGSMSRLLVEIDLDPEELESGGLPVSGVLRDVLIRITIEPELLGSSGSPVSGVLRDPLVVYDNWPLGVDTEDLQSGGLPVSGVLA